MPFWRPLLRLAGLANPWLTSAPAVLTLGQVINRNSRQLNNDPDTGITKDEDLKQAEE